MMNCSTHKQEGYTLLELLLFLSLVCVIVLAMIRLHRYHESQAVTEQAASEMQSMMSALLYYESVEGAWPEENTQCSDNAFRTETPFTQYYLPSHLVPSLFHTGYCWKENDKTDIQPLGLLSLDLPVKGDNPAARAQAIAALLPHASAIADMNSEMSCVESSPMCYVHTELVPAHLSSSSGMSLQSIGRCVPGIDWATCTESQLPKEGHCCKKQGDINTYIIRAKSCSKGYTMKIVYVPAYLKMVLQSYQGQQLPAYLLDSGYVRDSSITGSSSSTQAESATCTDLGTGTTRCELPVGLGNSIPNDSAFDVANAPSGYLKGSVGLVYVAACQKNRGVNQ